MRKLLPLLFLAILSFADGFIIWKETSPLERADQRAFIYYDEGKETLILSISYRGAGNDFAWLIPTPSVPIVSKAPDDFFQRLDAMLIALGGYPEIRAGHWGNEEAGIPMGDADIEVISRQKIGIYDVAVIKSTDPYALKNWLDKEGYKLPSSAPNILKPYIEKKWCFVVVKISKDEFQGRRVGEGNLNPIRIDFATSTILYPLRVSFLNREYLSSNISKIDSYVGHIVIFGKEWEVTTNRIMEKLKNEVAKRTPFENTHLQLLGFDELKKPYLKWIKGEMEQEDFLNLVRMVIANRLLEIAEREQNQIEVIVVAPYRVSPSRKISDTLRDSFRVVVSFDIKPGVLEKYLVDKNKKPLFHPRQSLYLTRLSAKVPFALLTDDLVLEKTTKISSLPEIAH
ncbi:DUF2330 domain-containing protein [bacterium]|nr:DUF2330 domain-containing protein [bacterium]